MKFISWNIDSLNAALTHQSARGEMSWATLQNIAAQKPDFFAIQEPKLGLDGLASKQEAILEELFPDYLRYINPSQAKSGYAGTMILTPRQALTYDKPAIGSPDTMDQEGRILTLEYDNFFVSTVYTPNSGRELKRLPDREQWDDAYRNYIHSLDQQKPVIFSGDFNVAHQEIDLKNPKSNHHSAGFTDTERQKFSELLAAGFIDTFRYQNPTTTDVYSWWAQISKTSKINNAGWRIDYYLTSQQLADKIVSTGVMDTGARQDHAPITLELKAF